MTAPIGWFTVPLIQMALILVAVVAMAAVWRLARRRRWTPAPGAVARLAVVVAVGGVGLMIVYVAVGKWLGQSVFCAA